MKPLPNPSVPLFEKDGTGNRMLTATLGNPPGANPVLVDQSGIATPIFRQYLGTISATPLPHAAVQLADAQGRPTRAFTMLLAALP